jgi:Tol biopolymer transport system component
MPHSFGIDRYLNIRSASGPSFSPDGRFASFLTSITGLAQLWQVPVEGGWPVQLTFTGDSVRAAAYSPRRPELVFRMDRGEKDHPRAMAFWETAGYRVDERVVRRVRTL